MVVGGELGGDIEAAALAAALVTPRVLLAAPVQKRGERGRASWQTTHFSLYTRKDPMDQ